jgi:hypothetical protein
MRRVRELPGTHTLPETDELRERVTPFHCLSRARLHYYTCSKPICFKNCAARRERSPAWHTSKSGRSRGGSSNRAARSHGGRLMAPGTCPWAYSSGSRTSRSIVSGGRASTASTETSGTVGAGQPRRRAGAAPRPGRPRKAGPGEPGGLLGGALAARGGLERGAGFRHIRAEADRRLCVAGSPPAPGCRRSLKESETDPETQAGYSEGDAIFP